MEERQLKRLPVFSLVDILSGKGLSRDPYEISGIHVQRLWSRDLRSQDNCIERRRTIRDNSQQLQMWVGSPFIEQQVIKYFLYVKHHALVLVDVNENHVHLYEMTNF